MMEYKVTITKHILEYCVDYIEADSEDEAYEIASNKFGDGDYDDQFENALEERASGGFGYEIDVEESEF